MKLKKKCFYLIIVILFIIFITTGYYWLSWHRDNKNLKKEIKSLEKVEVLETPDTDNTEIIESKNESKESLYWQFLNESLINVNIKKLKESNKDTVGWIKVNGTNINYPYVQSSDNKYYLNHTYKKEKNGAGWVYLDYRNNIQASDKNTIIYAHGRENKTMFGSLKKALTSGWLNNTDNYIIKTVTEYESNLWQVFSIYRIPETSDYLKINFQNDEEFSLFASMLLNRSEHDFKATISGTDKIITLSTCYDDETRMVLHAKLIKRTTK